MADTDSPTPLPTLSRRRLLRAVGGAGVAFTVAGAAGVRRAIGGGDGWEEVPSFLTDASVFYSRFEAKRFDPMFWWIQLTRPEDYPVNHEPKGALGLRIEGAVDRTLDLSEDELLARFDAGPRVELLKTMQCSGDGPEARLASNGVWTGIPLRPLLEEAGVRPEAVRLHVHGDDRFTAGLRLSDLERPDGRQALLVFELNGEPLPTERGGPYRLLVPDKYGFKNVKWPRRIALSEVDEPWGNHEVVIEGGTDDGDRRVGVKILSPNLHRRQEVVETDLRERTLRGVAFGGTSPVRAVWVRIGEDEWQPARVDPPAELESHPVARAAHRRVGSGWPLADVWAPWTFRWTPPGPGEYEVEVHVENEAGEATVDRDEDWLDGDSSRARGWIRVV